MKRKIKTVRLLANFFRDEYYEAYKELIRQHHIARLLQSGDGVFRKPYCRNDLYRWLARHTNLGATFQTVKKNVNKSLTN